MTADVAVSLKDWSTTAASNQPDSTDPVGPNVLAENIRQIQATVRSLCSANTIASATTTDLGSLDAAFLTVSGTTTITGLGTVSAGIYKHVTFSGVLILTHNATSLILLGSANITTVAGATAMFESLGSGNWRMHYYAGGQYAALAGSTGQQFNVAGATGQSHAPRASQIQNQSLKAFTTTGTATAYVLTPTPVISANAENQEFDVEFHTAAGATPTLAISGQTALNLKYRDSTGAKQAVTSTQIPSGWRSKVVNDGTDWIVREVPPAASTSTTVPVRQTVLSGPVDSSGFAAFGGSTGSTTVTASGTLTVTAANGVDANGAVNRVGQKTNPSWTGLSTNGTMYLGVTVNADGTLTEFSTTLAPTYQWGGAYSTTANQRTFNIQEMVMKKGDGGAANQAYDVFVGEVTVSGGVVTVITWYALMGRYDSGYTNTLPGTATNTTKTHNLGIVPNDLRLQVKCLTAESNYSIGDVVQLPFTNNNAANWGIPMTPGMSRLTAWFTTSTVTAMRAINKTTGVENTLTAANWAYRLTAERGW